MNGNLWNVSTTIAMKDIARLLLVAPLLLATPAVADEADESVRTAARQVGKEGLDAYKRGEYRAALDKLNHAYEVVKAPTLGLWTARAMVKVGRLVEASERYQEATQLTTTDGDVALQEEARTVAAEEREALLPRIPRLTVSIVGIPAEDAEVELDGVQVASARLGEEMRVNPGARRVVARAGGRTVTQQVALAEGEHRRVTLDLTPPRAAQPPTPVTREAVAAWLDVATAPSGTVASAPSPSVPSGPDPSPGADRALDSGAQTGSALRAFGWTVFGIGCGGLVAGGVAGAMLLETQSQLDASDDCEDHACGPAQHDEVDRLNSLRGITTAALAIGGVGLATGLTLVLVAPTGEDTASARVSPWVGLGAAGVAGRF